MDKFKKLNMCQVIRGTNRIKEGLIKFKRFFLEELILIE